MKGLRWIGALVLAVMLAASAFGREDADLQIREAPSQAHRLQDTGMAFVDGAHPAGATGDVRKMKETSGDTLEGADAPRVAVTGFGDNSHARIDQLGAGFADKLAQRLAEDGIWVVGRSEIDSLMQEQGLDPTSLGDLSRAARELGANLLITGTIESFVVDSTTLDLGLVRLAGAEARVEATAELIDSSADAVALTATAAGSGKGSSGLSIGLGSLFSASPSCDVCEGGLRVERTSYVEGELVSIGYANRAGSGWFGLEVDAGDGTFLRWLGWRFVAQDACETWFWNQRDALGTPVGAGTYTVRLLDGEALAERATFQVQPGIGIAQPSFDEITVGAAAFDATIAGAAIDAAVGEIAASFLPAILAHTESLGSEPARGMATEESGLLGQIASLLPDGRAEINVGASSGVAVGDRFEVLTVGNLAFDLATQDVIAYDVLETKGEIQIVEVRDRASTGVRLGEFDPLVGDLVRLVP